ncbi:MAG: OmpH family outer membrane protein [Sphingomonas sp.]
MKTFTKFLLASTLAPAAFVAAQANAQVAGVAVSDTTGAILNAKALGVAHDQIVTAHKAELDQIGPKIAALQAQVDALTAPLAKGADHKVTPAEYQAAVAAKNPIVEKVRAVQTTAQAEVAKLNEPTFMAQAWAIQQVAAKYDEAVRSVAAAKSINFVMTAESLQFSKPEADITTAVTTQLNVSVPTVSITPQQGWQPSQSILQLTQVYFEALQREGAAAQARPAAAAGTPPKKPAGR